MLKNLFAGTKWDLPCERCSRPLSRCECPPAAGAAPGVASGEAAARNVPGKPRATAIVRLEKRPGGKKVTVVLGLAAPDLEALLPPLKALCGAGGTIKDDRLEVQGDHRQRVADHLASLGHRAKLGNQGPG